MSERPPWHDRCDLPNWFVLLLVAVVGLVWMCIGIVAGEGKARSRAAKQEQSATLERIERRMEELEKR